MSIQVALIVALGLVVPLALSLDDKCTSSPEWHSFKKEFNKHYKTKEEDERRCELWLKVYTEVHMHNLNESNSYTRAVYHFADWTLEESQQARGLLVGDLIESVEDPLLKANITPVSSIPTSWDWRTKKAVTPIKNQGSCGSCWAFGVTGVMEAQYFFKTKTLETFSEQNLLDCDSSSSGCNGGWPYNTLRFIKNTGGLETAKNYPYTGKKSTCRYSASRAVKMTVDNIYQVTNTNSFTDDLFRTWIYNYGPVSIAVCSSQAGFSSYRSGIYQGTGECKKIDHAVLLVGYVNTGSSCYFIVKNTWGSSWGQKGYIHMACGRKLLTYPTFATITV